MPKPKKKQLLKNLPIDNPIRKFNEGWNAAYDALTKWYEDNKIKLLPIILVILLCGCIPRGIPIEIYTSKEKAEKPYKDKLKCITRAISIEGNFSESESLMLWSKYRRAKSEEINTFAKYLIHIKYSPNYNGYYFRDKVYILFNERVKARTKILKRVYGYVYPKHSSLPAYR